MVQSILRLISSLLTIYMLIIFFRIIMTWFQGPFMSGPFSFVARITDPYLNYFRRFRFLQAGRIDFSPLAAIMVLVVVSNIVDSIAIYGRITLGLVLAILFSAIWSAAAFFLLFFIVLTVVRLIAMAFNANSTAPFWLTLDHILEPIAYRITSLLFRGKSVTYQRGLLLTGGMFFLAWLLGGFLIRQLMLLLRMIPF